MVERKATHPIDPWFTKRWSPRSMSGEELEEGELLSLFEAARWAPSSYNEQPWRFIYAKRNTEHWDKLFNLLVEFNQSWSKNAAALVLIISSKNFAHNNKPNSVHSFDAGSAWMSLALEASKRNVVAHGMAGFDYEKARTTFNIPEDYNVEAMCAIGKQSKKEDLPDELQKMEEPSDRKPLNEIAWEGNFKG
jgi:nitroreductase